MAKVTESKPKSRREILDALGTYQKTRFLQGDYENIIDDAFGNETDRGLVVILGSIIEDALVTALLDRFSSVSKSLEKDLTRSGGPLGTWAQQINLALAFGIIDDDDADDLEIFKTMRNACAHSRQPIDFNTSQLREALSLLYVDKIVRLAKTTDDRNILRQMFMFAAHYIMCRILFQNAKRSPAERYDAYLAQIRRMLRASRQKLPPPPLKSASQHRPRPRRPRPPPPSRV